MNETLEQSIERTVFEILQKNHPNLLDIIETFTRRGYSSEKIVEICVEASGQVPERLAFIGCAADYLINNPEPITQTVQ